MKTWLYQSVVPPVEEGSCSRVCSWWASSSFWEWRAGASVQLMKSLSVFQVHLADVQQCVLTLLNVKWLHERPDRGREHTVHVVIMNMRHTAARFAWINDASLSKSGLLVTFYPASVLFSLNPENGSSEFNCSLFWPVNVRHTDVPVVPQPFSAPNHSTHVPLPDFPTCRGSIDL